MLSWCCLKYGGKNIRLGPSDPPSDYFIDEIVERRLIRATLKRRERGGGARNHGPE